MHETEGTLGDDEKFLLWWWEKHEREDMDSETEGAEAGTGQWGQLVWKNMRTLAFTLRKQWEATERFYYGTDMVGSVIFKK